VPMAVRAMKAGAVEFLQKPVGDQVLLDRIQAVIARELERRRGQAEHRATAARLAELTPREREVLEHIVEGVATREIATRLGVSPKTVESHRGKILKKMEARSVLDLVRMVLRLQAGSADRARHGVED
jgi:two-component system, LuxR family, response regulator FixJ